MLLMVIFGLMLLTVTDGTLGWFPSRWWQMNEVLSGSNFSIFFLVHESKKKALSILLLIIIRRHLILIGSQSCWWSAPFHNDAYSGEEAQIEKVNLSIKSAANWSGYSSGCHPHSKRGADKMLTCSDLFSSHDYPIDEGNECQILGDRLDHRSVWWMSAINANENQTFSMPMDMWGARGGFLNGFSFFRIFSSLHNVLKIMTYPQADP